MAKLISKTYGDALLEVALEENRLEDFASEVDGLKAVLKENPDFAKLINNPRISIEDKLDVVLNVFKGRTSDELVGFLSTVVSKGRFTEIDAILEYFSNEVKKLKGIGVAYVTTPSELSEVQKSNVVNKLIETTEFNTMEMHYSVDPSLIGGMQIRIGDRVVDSSIHTKIMKMQQDLTKIQLG